MNMMKLLLFTLLAVVVIASSADAFQLTRCDNSTTTTLVKFSLSSCPHGEGRYCEFVVDQTVMIDLEFQTSVPIVDADAHLLMSDGWQWRTLLASKACGFLGLTCPTPTGTTLKVSDELVVTSKMHDAMYQYKLLNGGGQIVCIEFPVGLRDSYQSR